MTEVQLNGSFQEDNTVWGLDAWVEKGLFNIVTTSEDEAAGTAGAELNVEQVAELVAAALEYLKRARNGDYKDTV